MMTTVKSTLLQQRLLLLFFLLLLLLLLLLTFFSISDGGFTATISVVVTAITAHPDTTRTFINKRPTALLYD